MNISLLEIDNCIKPLDCIFFLGNEFVSKLIIKVEKFMLGVGDWSHIGIVVNKEIMPSLNVPDNDLYLWESTMSSNKKWITKNPVLDAESNSPVFGIQIRKLKDVLINDLKNNTKCGWGKLINNPIEKRTDETFVEHELRIKKIQDCLDKIHKENYHRSYTKNIFRLLSAGFSCCSTCRTNWCLGEDWRFCSQFVSIVYQELNIIPKEFDNEVILPQDIATPEKSEEHLPKIIEDVKLIKL